MVVDALVGPSLNWNTRGLSHRLAFIPEAGFHSIYFDVEEGYYFQVGFRLEYEYQVIGVALHSYLIVGSADEISLGTRNGLGISFFWGIFGIETSPEPVNKNETPFR